MTKQQAAEVVDIKSQKPEASNEKKLIKAAKYRIKCIKHCVKVLSVLKSHSVTFLGDVSKIQDVKSRELLENLESEIVFHLPKSIMCNEEGRSQFFSAAVGSYYKPKKTNYKNQLLAWKELAQEIQISPPTLKQLEETRFCLENGGLKINKHLLNTKNTTKTKPLKIAISDAEVESKYYNHEIWKRHYKNIIEVESKETEEFKQSLVKNTHNIYNEAIVSSSLEIEHQNQIILALQEAITFKDNNNELLGQLKYRSVLDSTRGKQVGNITDIPLGEAQQQEAVDLLHNLINNDPTLIQDEREHHLKQFETACNNNLSYEISRWLGKKLNKHEKRMLRAIRRIGYKHIANDQVVTYGKSLYEFDMYLTDIYEEWGLERRLEGGYQDNQTKQLKQVLRGTNGNTGLQSPILFKHEAQCTSERYILQIEDLYKTKNTKAGKKEELYGIRIALPKFLFVLKKDPKNFLREDLEGFKRFMKTEGMPQSNVAFELAEYLEDLLTSKKDKVLLNLEKMVNEAGLTELYKTRPTLVIQKITTVLDNMVLAKYLLKDYSFDKKGGQYDQGQYELGNIRAMLFRKHAPKNATKWIKKKK